MCGQWLMICASIANAFSNGLLFLCGKHIEHSNGQAGHVKICRDKQGPQFQWL